MKALPLLADANLPRDAVAVFVKAGHAVRLAGRDWPGDTSDDDLIQAAEAAGEVIITLDKDFGELVFRSGRTAAGVVLFRLPGADTLAIVERIGEVWPEVVAMMPGRFITVEAHRIRERPMP
jgi:predicted nuclease of predicted toxin-antitoxin system